MLDPYLFPSVTYSIEGIIPSCCIMLKVSSVFQACRPASACQQAEPAEDDGQEDGEDQKTYSLCCRKLPARMMPGNVVPATRKTFQFAHSCSLIGAPFPRQWVASSQTERAASSDDRHRFGDRRRHLLGGTRKTCRPGRNHHEERHETGHDGDQHVISDQVRAREQGVDEVP